MPSKRVLLVLFLVSLAGFSVATSGDAAPLAPKFPFSQATARKYQREYAERVGLPVEFTNRQGMTFVLIPPGVFIMGSPEDEPGRYGRGHAYDETPAHEVALTRP